LATDPDIELVAVVTAPARPSGRSQRMMSTPIGDIAAELGVPVLTPERLRAPSAVDEVLAVDPALVVLADYGQIVPAPLLELPRGALNLHPSLLPRHRGASPIPAAILAGDRETGVTLMRMDAGLDTGPIVAQTHVPLSGTETAPDLEAHLETVAAALLADNLRPWLRGEIRARPQPAEGASLTRSLRREDGRLDPDRPATELERQLRAYQPWPGSFLETPTGRIVVWAGHVLPTEPGDRPGSFVPVDSEALALATVEGRLALDEVQPAGGRRMSGAAYRRGLRDRWPGSLTARAESRDSINT
jgi:methionyl-tRNA formyltransferase